MNPNTNPIASRLSLRPPQRESLEILARVCEIISLEKNADPAQALAAIRSEFPSVTSFEREFPSICFALATGVGKTRLMGAFIAYLYRVEQVRNFFVLAPNLTIYNKLQADFHPGSLKYVFKGIAEFAVEPPVIITGENYEQLAGHLFNDPDLCKVNIFNISKINSEVRGGKSPRIKRMAEYLGQPYFDYLAGLDDLVLLMDESHRYRASAGVRAINELKPILGLELTATPFVETSKGPVAFSNVIYDYPLGRAMADGFVKEPAVVTRKDFNPGGMSAEEIERMKLDDGIALHETVKVELETYARQTDNRIVKPFVLVIARDTTHAAQLMAYIKSDACFGGRYKERVIQVDSSMTGAQEDEMVQRLLAVESPDEPTEIVIHVNMLKEGWDVTNLYTIVPLRAANARTLIEQSIGRGLRLPYGKRTGVAAVDRLNIVAHDRFQEIVDEANRPGSAIRLQQVILTGQQLAERTVTVVAQSQLASSLGVPAQQPTTSTLVAPTAAKPVFTTPDEQQAAKLAYDAIRKLEGRPDLVPTASRLQDKKVQAELVKQVAEQFRPHQPDLPGIKPEVDIAAIVAKTAAMVVDKTIDIPRILVVPTGEVRCGFKPFKLKLDGLRYQPPSDELWVQHLRTNTREVIALGKGSDHEARSEDYVVSGLVDFDDVSYDDHADLLYDLAGQVVTHLRSYLSDDDARKVLRCFQKPIAQFVHSQMQEHYWEEATGYEVKVSKGFTELKPSAYTASASEPIRDFMEAPPDKANIAKYVFGGFQRCLYPVQKFQSDTERKLAVVLDRDALKWFKPAKGQFQIFYLFGGNHLEYQPDFVAEGHSAIYMLEPKASNAMTDPEVLAKRDAAVKWCQQATEHARSVGGKAWKYVFVPHDAVATNVTLEGLAQQYTVQPPA
ncbi:MAG: type III restriction endonuclease subunit R [Phycisphaerae bacterium]|nr:MAG: type III restriction endonuclease subunit R [Phycisphaerae bacterium]